MRAQELPDLDVTLRGAVSIARRLQDPLAELVKVDRNRSASASTSTTFPNTSWRSLDAIVEDCVNAVGVDVNTASAKLLARVSGVGESLAQSIVAYRNDNGPYRTRADLKSAEARPRLRTGGWLPRASMAARTRSTVPGCIRKPIRSCARSSPRPDATSAR